MRRSDTNSMIETSQMKPMILASWREVIAADRKFTEYDLIRQFASQGARAVDILDAFAEALNLDRGYISAIAQDLVSEVQGCGGEVAAHLQKHYGIHPASMVFGTGVDSLPRLLSELGLAELPLRWLDDSGWVWGLETLPGQSIELVGIATWGIGTFSFFGQPDARLYLPGLDVDSGLILRDCDLFSFDNIVGSLRLSGQIRGGRVKVVGSSVTEGPTDLSEMLALISSHHTHILSEQGTEAELRLPRFPPERVEFVRTLQ